MYCIKCGVELADSEKVCPLCGTKVYHPELRLPDAPSPFPIGEKTDPRINRKSLMFLITLVFIAAVAQLVICELSIPGANAWAGLAIGGVLLLYIIVFLPMWFRRPNPVIFVPCDYAAILLYVLYLCLIMRGHWFLSFALPVIGVNCIIVTAVVVLLRYVHRGRLYIIGGALIAYGAYMALLEHLIGVNFLGSPVLHWSYFPLVACFVLGLGLIVIAICKPIKEALKKKLFF